ncbi:MULTISPECIES: hypothetical protein [Actinomycetes]|uniref:hypothetical protein n=1 Tax=Actinomycetes TaxID=1760 RepID=UPI0004C13A28|nr:MULTISPECIES: hypothetical protein [Actinomycetes]
MTQDPDKQPMDPDRDGPDLEKSSSGPDVPVEVPSDLSGMPSLAELDAMDLAAIEAGRQSKDKDHAVLDEPTPPPAALYHAWLLWLGGAAAALVSVVYGFVNSGSISDLLNERLQADVARDPDAAAPADRIDSLSSFFPPAMLVATLVLLAVQYPLLVATSRHRSRGARNVYVTAVLVMLLCIPMGIDLLFDYPSISGVIKFMGWLQFTLLLLSALFTLRRGVNRWLPPSMRMKPTQIIRPGNR